jgi:hypothetical protein
VESMSRAPLILSKPDGPMRERRGVDSMVWIQ